MRARYEGHGRAGWEVWEALALIAPWMWSSVRRFQRTGWILERIPGRSISIGDKNRKTSYRDNGTFRPMPLSAWLPKEKKNKNKNGLPF
jgi:hypothetical protein